MKPIEERANAAWSDYEYREGELYSTCFIDGFSAGAQSERDELTRWRDPKVELPNDNRDVLVKTTLCREYCIAFYKANGGRNHHWHENNGSLDDDMGHRLAADSRKRVRYDKSIYENQTFEAVTKGGYVELTITGYARFVGGCGINQNVEFYAVLRSMGVYSVAR